MLNFTAPVLHFISTTPNSSTRWETPLKGLKSRVSLDQVPRPQRRNELKRTAKRRSASEGPSNRPINVCTSDTPRVFPEKLDLRPEDFRGSTAADELGNVFSISYLFLTSS